MVVGSARAGQRTVTAQEPLFGDSNALHSTHTNSHMLGTVCYHRNIESGCKSLSLSAASKNFIRRFGLLLARRTSPRPTRRFFTPPHLDSHQQLQESSIMSRKPNIGSIAAAFHAIQDPAVNSDAALKEFGVIKYAHDS